MYHTQEQTFPRVQPTFFGQTMFYFALAILVSALGTILAMQYWMEYFIARPGLMYLLFAAELILVFTSRLWSARRPLNYLLFAAFTFITGVTLAPLLAVVIAQAGGPQLVSKALIATGLMFTATAAIGYTTKRELSGLRGWLLMALVGMIIVSLIGIFVPWSSTFEMIFSGIGIILFSAYTMYDFHLIQRGYLQRPMDAALMLYLDIFNLFIYMLRFMSSSRD